MQLPCPPTGCSVVQVMGEKVAEMDKTVREDHDHVTALRLWKARGEGALMVWAAIGSAIGTGIVAVIVGLVIWKIEK